MSAATVLLLVHAAATCFMLGLIWFVQVVHYPLFAGVGEDAWVSYAAAHTRRTGWVVGPPMLAEAVTGVLLLGTRPDAVPAAWAWVGVGLLVAVWASTALLQVPRHRLLAAGFDVPAWRLLVATNWLRTAAWSARGALALAMIGRALG